MVEGQLGAIGSDMAGRCEKLNGQTVTNRSIQITGLACPSFLVWRHSVIQRQLSIGSPYLKCPHSCIFGFLMP